MTESLDQLYLNTRGDVRCVVLFWMIAALRYHAQQSTETVDPGKHVGRSKKRTRELTGSRPQRRTSVLMLLILLLPSALSAQGMSHGYVSAGAGATDLNGGLDWVIADGPIGIGGDIGGGWVFLAAIIGSYHLLTGRPRTHDVFATLGYAGLGNSEFSSQGVTVGGGMTYWPAAHLGVRFDGFGFLPVAIDNNIPADQRSPSRYWGVRAGVAVRVR